MAAMDQPKHQPLQPCKRQARARWSKPLNRGYQNVLFSERWNNLFPERNRRRCHRSNKRKHSETQMMRDRNLRAQCPQGATRRRQNRRESAYPSPFRFRLQASAKANSWAEKELPHKVTSQSSDRKALRQKATASLKTTILIVRDIMKRSFTLLPEGLRCVGVWDAVELHATGPSFLKSRPHSMRIPNSRPVHKRRARVISDARATHRDHSGNWWPDVVDLESRSGAVHDYGACKR